MTFNKTVESVFTPRSPEVNPKMYVERLDLERELNRALLQTQHLLIHGESGCGKSWLYKKVLSQRGVVFVPANLAKASLEGGIVNELKRWTTEKVGPQKTAYEETKAAKGTVGLPGAASAEGTLSNTSKYVIPEADPLDHFLSCLRKEAGSKEAIVVLDNLEAIYTNQPLMRELGDIITLLDDVQYAKHNIKLLIVGVPAGVRDYFSRVENRTTVVNRLRELPEVGKLSKIETEELIKRGFIDELGIHLSLVDLTSIQLRTIWVTECIPQCVHEYCLEIAYLLRDAGGKFSDPLLDVADKKWLSRSLQQSYEAVEEVMNDRATTAGRRNQVLYCLGRIEKSTFRYDEIEALLRSEFPESTRGVSLNISSVLAEIARTHNPPIKLTPKQDSYRFIDPRFKMCIRVMLKKVAEKVAKIDPKEII